MYPPQQSQYDRAITVFSPDGRLFQVEYAREAVKNGPTSIGVVCKDGVAMVAHKRISSSLIVGDSYEKLYQIDDHLLAASSGLAADARKLVDFARLEAQRHRLVYGDEMPVTYLAKQVGDHIQFFTQVGGVRPYGVSLLLAGVGSEGARLFETDPSGAIFEYKATAIGSGKKGAEQFFEKEYKEGLSLDEGVKLALRALRKVAEEKLTAQVVDISVVELHSKKSRAFSNEEIAKYLASSEGKESKKD